MLEHLYLDSGSVGFLFKGKEQTGEQQGGKYVARVVTGSEKDGSPLYRYFRTQSEYNDYLARKRDAKKEGRKKVAGGKKGTKHAAKERLQAKLKKEQERSNKKSKEGKSGKKDSAAKKKQSLFVGGNKVKKSVRLFIGDNNE